MHDDIVPLSKLKSLGMEGGPAPKRKKGRSMKIRFTRSGLVSVDGYQATVRDGAEETLSDNVALRLIGAGWAQPVSKAVTPTMRSDAAGRYNTKGSPADEHGAEW